MTSTPPDLTKPYPSDREREADREDLVRYWYGLESLIDLAALPPDKWSESQQALIARFSSRSKISGHPSERLKRWTSLYSEELDLIRNVRDRVVRGDIVTDTELLGATWMARQLLATIADIPPTQVEQRWVRSVVAQAAPEVP